MDQRWIFDGHIAGIGTESGLRAVVGLWRHSPFGPFADAMVQLPSGHRILLAPTAEIADFIAAVYNFDETRVVDVAASQARTSSGWTPARSGSVPPSAPGPRSAWHAAHPPPPGRASALAARRQPGRGTP